MSRTNPILFQQEFPLGGEVETLLVLYVKAESITVALRVGGQHVGSVINAPRSVALFYYDNPPLSAHFGSAIFTVPMSQLDALQDFLWHAGIPCRRHFFGAQA